MSSLDAFYENGPKTVTEAFPPVCLRSHWDPTMLTRHVLPDFPSELFLALDPRPSAEICTAYYTTSAGDAPLKRAKDSQNLPTPLQLLGGAHRPEPSSSSSVFPPGGAARTGFPYKGYMESVNRESDLLRLNEELTKCAEKRFLGPPAANVSNNVIAGADNTQLSPYALVVNKQAGCRNADDEAAWNRSARLFFNPTRYDRTTNVPTGVPKAEGRNALAC